MDIKDFSESTQHPRSNRKRIITAAVGGVLTLCLSSCKSGPTEEAPTNPEHGPSTQGQILEALAGGCAEDHPNFLGKRAIGEGVPLEVAIRGIADTRLAEMGRPQLNHGPNVQQGLTFSGQNIADEIDGPVIPAATEISVCELNVGETVVFSSIAQATHWQ